MNTSETWREHIWRSASPDSVALCEFETGALSGTLIITPGNGPGLVRVDVHYAGTANECDEVSAEVREGWLRAMADGAPSRSVTMAMIARALAEIASIPAQTTVRKVTFQRSA